jgi:hypothetical protein
VCRGHGQRGRHRHGGQAAGGGRVAAAGHWDARGTLGVDRDTPIGLTDITLHFDLDTDAEPATVERLVATSERYCVIHQSLRTPPRLAAPHRIAAL